jgi:hypothetical protein
MSRLTVSKPVTLQWAVRCATHLNGMPLTQEQYEAQISDAACMEDFRKGDGFGYLARELGSDVDLTKLTDVHRHDLLRHWRTFSAGYEPYQFHVRRNGLALLVAYLLHLIEIRHVKIPT